MESSEKIQLEKLVNESASFTEILRKQGKAISGAAVKVLKHKLDEYGIKYFFLKEKEIHKKLELSEILKKDRPYKSSALKQRLIESGLKKDVCEICDQGPVWNGKHLQLQLDHINGDHNDNRLENLRILCPNCHTQTETFCGNKKKSSNHCIDCGKEIEHNSVTQRICKRCATCQYEYEKKLKRDYWVKNFGKNKKLEE